MRREAGEGTDLWRVITGPVIWSVHFLLCYTAVAVYCAKLGEDTLLGPMRWYVAAVTLVALAALGVLFVSTWRVRAPSTTDRDLTFEANSPEERHRFLAHVTLMLCVLSIVGVIYVAIPAVFVETCR